jgi:cell division protein FtsI/penicillin-binding protein 2
VGGKTIHESHGRGSVRWSLSEIVTHSSNVGTVKLGLKLGKEGLYDALASFGLTEKTGIDFPGEAIGWLPRPAQWSASSIGNIPFGQGVSLTPLQLSRAVGAIANEGVLTTPHFLLEVPRSDEDPTIWQTERAVSASTAKSMNKVLTAVVKSGTGSLAAVPGYTVAGKTGTAQKAMPGGRGYAAGKYVGSFVGYLPAEDPQVLVCVTLDEPSNGVYYGGTVAAPTFAKLAQFTVEHLKVPPSSKAVRDFDKSGKSAGGAGVGKVSDDEYRD